jgi:hypothetical protein
MFSVLHTKLICSMDHGECSDALFEVTRSIDDILWLNIRRCIYGALIPSRVKGVALANFRCNGLACDELPFYFFLYGCLIPTQGKTQIILLLDAKMHLVL